MHKNCDCPDSTWIKAIYSLPSQYKIRTTVKSSPKVWFTIKIGFFFFYKFRYNKGQNNFLYGKNTENCSVKCPKNNHLITKEGHFISLRGFSSCCCL